MVSSLLVPYVAIISFNNILNAASLTIPLWFKYNCLFVSISIITSWFFVCKFFNKLIDIFDHLISYIQVLHVSFFKDIPLLRIYSGNSDILKLVVCLLILGVWLICRRMSRYLLWVYLRKKWSPDDYVAWKSACEGEGGGGYLRFQGFILVK